MIKKCFFVIVPLFYGLFMLPSMGEVLPGLSVSHAWVRDLPPNAPTTALYLEIRNSQEKEVSLLELQSSDFSTAEFHQTQQHDGMMKMKKLEKLTVPPKGVLKLAPHGTHVMLISPLGQFKLGDELTFRLIFDDGTEISMVAPIQSQ